jgi:hypothetical protein
LRRVAASRAFKLLAGDDGLASAFAAPRRCCGESGTGPLLNQVALELTLMRCIAYADDAERAVMRSGLSRDNQNHSSATISTTANGCNELSWIEGGQARSRDGGGLKGQALPPSIQLGHLNCAATWRRVVPTPPWRSDCRAASDQIVALQSDVVLTLV